MLFVFPEFMYGVPELDFRPAATRMAKFGEMVGLLKQLNLTHINLTHCKEVAALYEDAVGEVLNFDDRRKFITSRGPKIQVGGCLLLLTLVESSFITPLKDLKRYLVIPFESIGELDTWANEWVNFYKQKNVTFEIVKYKPYGEPLKDVPSLAQIYILGHGSPGDDVMSSGKPHHQRLNADVVAFRMKQMKLSESFCGRIKIFACSGGRGSDQSSTCLSGRIANAMRGYKYQWCEYFGYLEDLRAPAVFEMADGKKVHTISPSPATQQEIGEELVNVMKEMGRQLTGDAYEAAKNYATTLANVNKQNRVIKSEPAASSARRQF